MRPLTIGRAVGIGVRVAGRMVGEVLAGQAQAVVATQSQSAVNAPVQANCTTGGATAQAGRAARRSNTQKGAGLSRGVSGFFAPLRRAGGIVWLEVTGVFFLLPVVVFTPNLWRMRASWAQGPDHRMFVITAIVVAVFLYLGVSSFWRARRK